MKELIVNLPNDPSALARACDSLGRVGVNIKSLSAESDKIRIITEDETTAQKALSQEGFKPTISDIYLLKLDDRPGELAKVAYKLAHAKVNVESMYLITRDKGVAEIALIVDSVEKTEQALKR